MANKRLLWSTDGLFLFQMASEEGGVQPWTPKVWTQFQNFKTNFKQQIWNPLQQIENYN